MENNVKESLTHRILAGALAFLMVFSMLPFGVIDVFAESGQYTVEVRDNDTDEVISEASVTIFDSSSGEVSSPYELDTDEIYTYSASAEGYETGSGGVEFPADGNVITIKLTKSAPVNPTYTVTITVTDGENALEGTTVTLGEDSTTTDGDGKAEFSGISAGSYIISAAKSGYKGGSLEITVVDTDVSEELELTTKAEGEIIFDPADGAELVYGNSVTVSSEDYADSELNIYGTGFDVDALTVTMNTVGDVTVNVTASENDDYLGTSASATYTVAKAPLAWSVAEIPTNLIYTDTFTNRVAGVPENKVTYSGETDGISVDAATGEVTATKPGSITVTATVEENDYYEGGEISYTVSFAGAQSAGYTLSFADGETETAANTLDYVRAATLAYNNTAVEGANIYYTSSDVTVAEVATDGALTIHKAGAVTITASWQEDELHAPVTASYDLTVSYVDHTVSFGETNNAEITFNDYNNEYTVSAVSSAELSISYSVVSGNATITGNVLTITGAGVIEVSATAGSDVYATSTDTFALNVKKYTQTIEFAESDYSVALGATFTAPTASVSSAFSNDNAIVYSVESDDNGIIESFNSETGAYTLKLYTTGTVTIKAVKAGDSNYTDAVASYSITVTAASAEGKYYFNGEAVKEWYKTDVELTAAENCTILDPAEDKALEKTTFEDEGLHTVSFRVQTTEGISEVITKTFSIDKTDPAVSISTGEISVWNKVLSFFTGNENKLFEVTFSDNSSGSGIDKVYYTVENTTDIKTKDEIEAITEWTEYDPAEKISVGANKVFIIYVKVVDKAENANYARTNGVIFENIKPTIDIAYSDNSIEGDPVFNTDIPMTVTVVDGGDEVYSGLKSVNYTINLGDKVLKTESIVVDGAEDPTRADLLKDHSFEVKIPASYVENEETYYINSDAVVLTVTATDRSGNSLTSSKTFKISTAKPVIEVEWQNDPQIIATESGINYYNAARTAKITISGNAFALVEPGNGTVVITEHGGDHTDTHNTYSISQWTPAEDGKSYSATVSFAGSAVYDSFTVSYSDAVNAAESVSFTNFAVDLDTPTGSVSISNEDTWTTLVNTLTFKLFGNTDVTVSAVGNDNTSPWTVKYYKTDAKTAIDPSALPDEEWQESAPPIGANETVTVYVKITDIVGHPAFISTDGYIADNTDGVINTVYSQANANGFHNANVPITVTPNDVDENGNYSGIKSLEYWIVKDNAEGEHTNLYTYTPENSYFTELQSSVERSFTVVAADNNSNNVTVHIKAVDNSDNEFTEEIPLKIDVTAPTSKLSFVTTGEDESLNAPKVVENLHYFDQKLIATLVYTERNFSKEEAVEGIVISKNGNTLSTEEKNAIISWTDVAGATPDEATHTATIDFTENAHYTLAVTYTDLAGNSMVNVDVTDQSCYSPWEFTVDTVSPSAKVKLDGTTKWTELLESLTFGIWKNETITISIEPEESVSPLYPVQYYVYEYAAADSANLTKTDLNNLAGEKWIEGTSVNLNASARSVVYFKITDYSGNQNYFSTDGIIVETIKSGITVSYPDTVMNGNKDTGYYNGDITVHINVTDDYPFSGISKIEWWTTLKDTDESDERIGQSTATLYEFQHGDSVQFSELLNAWEGDVTVSAETNSSDYVRVHVKVTDNAGNVKETDEPYIKIDAKDPQISIRFDESTPVTITENGRGYFGAERKAWIKVTERTSVFEGDTVKSGIVIEAINAAGNSIDGIDDIKAAIIGGIWVTEESAESSDLDTHTLELNFTEDANYDFSVSYTNKLGKTCYYEAPVGVANATVVTFQENTSAKKLFTVDKTKPYDYVINADTDNWNDLIATLTFDLLRMKRGDITVSAEAKDMTSPFDITFYKTNDKTAKTVDELKVLAAERWKSEENDTFKVSPTDAFTVYACVRDYAGNEVYFSTNGIIADTAHSAIEFVNLPTASGKHNGVSVFNKDIKVTFRVSDEIEAAGRDSGIKSVDYWIVNYNSLESFNSIADEYVGPHFYQEGTAEEDRILDENGVPKIGDRDKLTVERTNLFSFNYEGDLTYDKFVHTLDADTENTTINISARANNSCYVVLFVQVTDNAGNVYTKTAKFDFDVDSPSISISFNDNSPRNGKYYNRARTATISYGDSRNGHLSGMSPSTTGKFNGSSVVFDTDGEHHLSASVSDIAGNGSSSSAESFIIDLTKPIATIKVGDLGSWSDLLETLTFALWSRDKVNVSAEYSDATSPIESAKYYKTSDVEIMTAEKLDALGEDAWTEYEPFEVEKDEQFAVYLRVVDYAGNVAYFNTDGIIVDANAPVEESISPEITIDPVQPINEIYNGDVKVAISVVDPTNGETYSGLKEVSYRVINLGEVTQNGVLYAFDLASPTRGELLERWTGEITVDSKLNNSNDVVIEVSAVDNAGNTSTDNTAIKIDITNPRIDVSYNLNNPDSGSYYRNVRTATIRVTERNFDPNGVVLTVANTYGAVPVLSAWTEQSGTGNGDNTVHTATLNFANDGVYTFNVTCADLASNPSGEPNFIAGTANATNFTVDRTLPAVSVSFDNNDVRNDTFFNAERTATVTVVERNFNVDRVRFTMTASLDGEAIAIPEPVWTNNGDTHVATIAFDADGDYTFDVTATDIAGNNINGVNYGESAAYSTFTVDKMPPTLAVSGILDESANNSAGNIGFMFTATDINFDALEPTFNAVFFENGEFVTEALSFGETVEIDHGKQFIVENLERDGIYRITCVAVDKAGNGYVEVVLDNSDGSTTAYERKEGDNLLTFSVNRNGSTFEIDEYTTGILKNYYVQNVLNDVKITEINADPLKSFSVTVNNKELTEGTDYTVTESGENWKKYVYSINKAIFNDEGEYNVVIASMDKADNAAYSDVKDAGIDFVVDRTPPVVTVSGMQTDGRYQVEKQTVTIIPTDDGGALNNLTVRLVDRNGDTIREIYNLSGEELEEAITANGGALTFDIEEGLFQNVEVICTDLAAGEVANLTNTYDVTFENVSVSTSSLAIFWANRPLRWGVIGGTTGVIAAGTGTIIFLKKKKKIK